MNPDSLIPQAPDESAAAISSQDYYSFRFEWDADAEAEVIIAYLSDLPFESFEESDRQVKAYLPASSCDDTFYDLLNELIPQFHLEYSQQLIPAQNWNAVWESNFQPIRIGNFCTIRADFHEPAQGVQFDLVINPRMAFGTGHHATTRLMIEAMQQLPIEGAKVLDYGCGTGILAIVAAKLGAAQVVAVDIEQAAYENSLQNIERNGGGPVKVLLGSLAAVRQRGFDLVLANINRNVILESLAALYDKLKPGAYLVISGFLESDEQMMLQKIQSFRFFAPIISRSNNWLCMTLKRL